MPVSPARTGSPHSCLRLRLAQGERPGGGDAGYGRGFEWPQTILQYWEKTHGRTRTRTRGHGQAGPGAAALVAWDWFLLTSLAGPIALQFLFQ
jgi:hypothetical protein